MNLPDKFFLNHLSTYYFCTAALEAQLHYSLVIINLLLIVKRMSSLGETIVQKFCLL